MAGKRKKNILSVVDVNDADEVRTAFLAMRVRASQMVSRASRAIRESHRLQKHMHLLTMEMEVARQSLITLQKDLDGMLAGIERAQKRYAREMN